MGRQELAIAEGETGVKLSGGSTMITAALAQTLATAGRKKEAIQLLDGLTKLATQKYVAPCFFAGIHLGLEEPNRAIECLEKSFEETSHWLIFLHIDTSINPLHPVPRFIDIIHPLGP